MSINSINSRILNVDYVIDSNGKEIDISSAEFKFVQLKKSNIIFKISKNIENFSGETIGILIEFTKELLSLESEIDVENTKNTHEFFMSYYVNSAYNTDLMNFVDGNKTSNLVETIFRCTLKHLVHNVKELNLPISTISYDNSRSNFIRALNLNV